MQFFYKIIIISILTLFSAQAAFAKWYVAVDEDPITDEKYAFIAQSDEYLKWTIGFRCEEINNGQFQIRLMTPYNYKDDAEYRENMDVKLRVDKNEVLSFKMELGSLSDKVTYFFDTNAPKDVSTKEELNAWKLLDQLQTSKKRLASAVQKTTKTYNVKGSTKAVKTFKETCNISTPIISK